MYGNIKEHLQAELQTIEENGILKRKNYNLIQGAEITISKE
jgi:glycine C-acetyltransferase